MFTLKLQNERIYFRDIKPEHLPVILEWYNKVDEFKFATGIDTPITFEKLTQKYAETSICSNEFFVGIHTVREYKMIGLLKGSFRRENGKCALWISSLAIDRPFQNQGYGSDSINLLFGYVQRTGSVENAYISVIESNSRGRAFWFKQGFKEIRKISNHIRLDNEEQNVIIMQKSLLCKTFLK